MDNVTTGLNAWADRIFDFIEANQKPIFLVLILSVAARFLKLRVGVGKA